METDVTIIGAGIAGTAIARELSRFRLDVTLIEKDDDVSSGSTKANHGLLFDDSCLIMAFTTVLKSIMVGEISYLPDSMKQQYCREGSKLFDQISKELDVPYKNLGMLIVATNDEEAKGLEITLKLAEKMPIRAKMLDQKEALAVEPNVTRNTVAGLYQPPNAKYRVIFAPSLAIALAENASQNGVKILLETEAQDVVQRGNIQIVKTNHGYIKTRFIVNAAGAHADEVADLAGARDGWGLEFNKTQMHILDKRLEGLFKNSVHSPSKPGSFSSVYPQVHGNPYIACGEFSKSEREETETTREFFQEGIARAKRLIPSISERDIIASFVGVRTWNTRDPESPIIELSEANPRFINAVPSVPGVAPALAIAKRVPEILAEQGLRPVKKENFDPYRKSYDFDDLSERQQKVLLTQNPQYGHVICRCELVPEGEIVEAIKRGPRTTDAIKKRTRAGMGRCQGGFCGPRIVRIIARELNIPATQVTKKGIGSWILLSKTKNLLRGD